MVQASSSGATNISKLNKLERINWFIAKKHPALLPQRITSLTLFSSATSELVTVVVQEHMMKSNQTIHGFHV